MAGSVIGLPPVLNFGSPEIKAKVVPEVLSGQKPICLAISEAFAGSDVSGLKTFAKKTEDGKHWIINGTKKWITNGTWVSMSSHTRIIFTDLPQFRTLVSFVSSDFSLIPDLGISIASQSAARRRYGCLHDYFLYNILTKGIGWIHCHSCWTGRRRRDKGYQD